MVVTNVWRSIVRVHASGRDPGGVGEHAESAGGAVAVHAFVVAVQPDGPAVSAVRCVVYGATDRGRQGSVSDSVSLSVHPEDAVAAHDQSPAR